MKRYILFIILYSFSTVVKSQVTEIVEPAFEMLTEYQKIRDFTMNNNGDEAYLTIQSPLEEVSVIVVIQKQNDQWLEPEIVSFSGKYRDLEPFLSPDNSRLYFASNRPLEQNENMPKDFDIWYVEREKINAAWSDPKNLGAPVNSEHNEFYPAVTDSKNLYITSDNPESNGQDDIFYCEWEDNHYAKPVPLSKTINSEGYEFNAYISPDESFIIFSGYNRKDGYGSGDLYISFRGKDLRWRKAANLGEEINSKYMDYCPFVDLKSQTLYFTSRRSALASANSIETIEDLKETINIYENGQSRIYKVWLKEKISGNINK